MENPQITWYIYDEETLTPYEEYYAGNVRPQETLEVTMHVWNNRWGQEDIKDVVNAKVAVFFDTIEDAYLLNMCTIKIDNGEFTPLTVLADRGRVNLGRALSGLKNTGSASTIGNYAVITLKFGPVTNGMRNSIKNLYVDLEFDV